MLLPAKPCATASSQIAPYSLTDRVSLETLVMASFFASQQQHHSRLPLPPPPAPSAASTVHFPPNLPPASAPTSVPVAPPPPPQPAQGPPSLLHLHGHAQAVPSVPSAVPSSGPLINIPGATQITIPGATQVTIPSGSQVPIPGASTPSPPTSVASLLLHHFQQEARQAGEREFDAGVGERQRQQDQLLQREGGAALARKRRKTRSAYVSRYAAKSYTKLLEQHVEREHQNAQATRSALAVQTERHARVRALIDNVENALNVIRGNVPSSAPPPTALSVPPPAHSAAADVPLMPPQHHHHPRTHSQDYSQPTLPPPLMSSRPLPPPPPGSMAIPHIPRSSGALATLGAVASSAATTTVPAWSPPPITLGAPTPTSSYMPPPPASRIIGATSIVRAPWAEMVDNCPPLPQRRKDPNAAVSEVSGSDHSDTVARVRATQRTTRDRSTTAAGRAPAAAATPSTAVQ